MAQKISYLVGAVLVILGVIGFFNDPIFGVFEVDTIHNVILIVAGLVLLGTARAGMAAMWAKIVGVVVAIVAVLGYVPPTDTVLGIVETNMASSVLQTVVAVVLLYAGFTGGSSKPMQSQNMGNMGGGMSSEGGEQ